MEEKNEMEKVDDVMLPGFRFHPTDEELVGFYLKRKVQQQSLPIELIKQVDIYKYDPWDLPKLSSTGEKEWYFYCPRDRKYRNSARPNRVTMAGFWKATGTDRPIYSSDHVTKCIGLKKSLVFYRGRAAKGFKTDWMMHEFRLPSVPSNNTPPKKLLDKTFPAHDSWAICRIFKKTNSMAQRGLPNSWAPQYCSQFSPEKNMSCTTEMVSAINQFCCDNNSPEFEQQQQQQLTLSNFAPYEKMSALEIPNGFMFSPLENSGAEKCCVGSLSTNNSNHNASESFDFDDFSMSQHQDTVPEEEEDLLSLKKSWEPIRSIGFPFNLPPNDNAWDFSLLPSPSDMSTNKCYNI